MNMRKLRKKLKIAIPLSCVAVCLLLVVGSFAAYISQAYVRGVLSTDESDVLFSSNYLRLQGIKNTTPYRNQTIIFQEGVSETVSFTVDIYNYLKENQKLVNQEDIEYQLQLVLSGSPNLNTVHLYSIHQKGEQPRANIFANGQNIYDYHTNDTVASMHNNISTRHSYTITMPRADLGRIRIQVVATPTDSSLMATQNMKLGGIISPSLEATVRGFACTGTFADANSSNAPYQFDAFNYEISITTGVASVTLTWDSTKVELDPFFVSKQKNNGEPCAVDATDELGYYKLNFDMDASIEPTLLVQFYRKISPKPVDSPWESSWANLKTVINVTGEQHH